MGKNNGSNNIPGWVKRDIRVLKRATVSLIETVRETRRKMAATDHEIRLQMVEMHKEDQRQMAENKARMAQNEARMAQNEARMAQNEARMAQNEARMEDSETRIIQNEKMIARLDEQTTLLKRSSDIHTKAILELLKKN